MLKHRIIPCLDIRNGQVTKGVEFQNNINLGTAQEFAHFYNQQGADELVVYDITASIEQRPPDAKTIQSIANCLNIPLTVGGGIKCFEDAQYCLKNGAEKVSLNSIVPLHPEIMSQITNNFGAQAVVLSLDALSDVSCPSGYRLVTHGGRTKTEWDLLHWILFIAPFGFGEICANSINQDGKKQGYDLNLIKLIANNINVPVIASGGAGTVLHVEECFKAGANAALLASVLHNKQIEIKHMKQLLQNKNYSMRLDF
jgi:imidazole glycerol-phosphate synthase subunit HisF